MNHFTDDYCYLCTKILKKGDLRFHWETFHKKELLVLLEKNKFIDPIAYKKFLAQETFFSRLE